VRESNEQQQPKLGPRSQDNNQPTRSFTHCLLTCCTDPLISAFSLSLMGRESSCSRTRVQVIHDSIIQMHGREIPDECYQRSCKKKLAVGPCAQFLDCWVTLICKGMLLSLEGAHLLLNACSLLSSHQCHPSPSAGAQVQAPTRDDWTLSMSAGFMFWSSSRADCMHVEQQRHSQLSRHKKQKPE
jgi:hypothetical protein